MLKITDLAQRGDFTAAGHEISAAVSADPTNSYVMYYAGVVANSRDEKQSAAQYLKRAVDYGYSRAEIERDPEFSMLRESDFYKREFSRGVK